MPCQIVQTAHASIDAARFGLIPSDIDHPHAVLIGIRNEIQLQKCLLKLEANGIKHKAFYEPDIGNQLTAIATETISGDRRSFFKNYTLLQSQTVGAV